MKTWFSIKAQAANDTHAEISIFDAIGMWGVTAKDFISELKAIDAKEITLSINSPGGSVFDAIAIYNALRASGSKITVRVMGVAASAASYIAMAGDKIVMPKNTFMMVHNPLNAIYGNAAEMRDMADILDKVGASLTATYVARTGRSEEDVKALLADETYMTADEAVANGFADEVEAELKIAAEFEVDRLPENIQAVFKAAVDKPELVEPVTSKTFAAEVSALAIDAGLAEHTSAWLLDATITTLDEAKAVISEAREVHALCEYAKQPGMSAKMIEARTPLIEARKQLCAIRAAASDATNVDSTQPGLKKPLNPVSPAAITPAAIWAARRIH